MYPLRAVSTLGRSYSHGLLNASSESLGRSYSSMAMKPGPVVRPATTNHQSKCRCSFASLSKPVLKSSVAAAAVENPTCTTLVNPKKEHHNEMDCTPVPEYLKEVYWWAYLHPNAIRVFERQWLVDAILWGNFNRLRDAALDELSTTRPMTSNHHHGDNNNNNNNTTTIEGRTLQVACVYGNFTELLAKRLAPGASLDVVDVAPIQMQNLTEKLQQSPYTFDSSSIHLSRNDAAKLDFDNGVFDQVIFFFLLHEMPDDVRRKALSEAARVLKKDGGKIVFVDYHRPTSALHPHRYIMPLVLNTLEPFAMDLWNYEIQQWLPEEVVSSCRIEKELFFGGLYQKVIVTRE